MTTLTQYLKKKEAPRQIKQGIKKSNKEAPRQKKKYRNDDLTHKESTEKKITTWHNESAIHK